MRLLILLILIFVVLIIGTPILIVLVLFPKTRPVGLSLLAAGGGLFLLMVLPWSGSPPAITQDEYTPHVEISAVRKALPTEHAEEIDPADDKSKPAWVDAPPRSVGDAYQMSVAVGPYTTRAECEAQLSAELQKALDRYAEVCLGGDAPERIVLPTDYLRQLVKDRWEEVRQYSVGPMTTLHVLLEFDHKAKDRVLDEHRRTQVAGRLWSAGLVWAAWLALLGVVYGSLRLARRGKSG